MRKTLREYCRQYAREDLLTQWHPTKNELLSPDTISYGSQRRIWWKCSRGHEWESPLYSRTAQNHGCPYCTGKRIPEGADFKTLFPDIAGQWHSAKNAQLKPQNYLPGSHVSVWWQCDSGHEWRATIKSRVEGNGCPVCSNRIAVAGVNDLVTVYPDIAKQWHPTKNGVLKPTEVVAKSERKVWWCCEKKHEWQAQVSSRISGRGCPVCAGKIIIPGENDLVSFDPELAKQWCCEKNGSLTPQQVSAYSNKKVWWHCNLGHEWQTTVSSRTFSKSGCPYCSNRKVLAGFNDLATVEPKVAAQWHPTRNAPLEPTMVMRGSTKRVWWKCPLGHEWKAVIYSRAGVQKCGCPVCAGKKPEYYPGAQT